MKNRTLLIGLLAIVLVILMPLAWWLASPLWINRSVNEAFPFELPAQETMTAMSAEELQTLKGELRAALPNEAEMAQLPAEQRQAMEQQVMAIAAALPAAEMDEPMPAEPEVVAQGQFVDGDSFHQGAGQATIYRLPDGHHILRFEGFSATNGPDLHVLLAANPAPESSGDLGEYVDLGSLKGNLGNQNYEISADVDLSNYKSVVIYCKPFHVVFATATLAS